MLLGRERLERLASASVAVVGLGAVGSYAVEGLARAGVGYLRVVDFDIVRQSNINRQLYALNSTIGEAKVAVAHRRILDINPECRVEPLRVFVDRDTVGQVVRPPLDVLIDAIDSVGPKVRLIASAVAAGVRVVACMGAATRLDPRCVRVGDIAETEVCPLARQVRKRLNRLGIREGVISVYSVEPPRLEPNRALAGHVDEASEEGEEFRRGRPRTPLGSLSCVTGMFGLLAAHQAVKMIADS